jgi:hypothetical protein
MMTVVYSKIIMDFHKVRVLIIGFDNILVIDLYDAMVIVSHIMYSCDCAA